MSTKQMSRRRLLSRSAAGAGALAFPYIVPRHVLGGPNHTPPSEVITRAVIGTGGRGRNFVERNDPARAPVTLAVCDVDDRHLASALEHAGGGCKACTDYRHVLDRDDIDVVYIATPPHWHALISIHAAQAGKDVYCEKPMTRFIHEGRAVVQAIKRYGRIFHIGTFGRYGARHLRKLVMSGLLGSPLLVRMDRQRYNWKVAEWSGRKNLQPQDPPAHLHWDMWLGPAPLKPYHPHRVHGSFRGYWDYDGGGFADMGAHYLDPIQYALGYDDTGPVEIEATAPWPAHPDAVGMWDTIAYTFADGTIIRCASGEGSDRDSEPEDAPWIEGPKGKVYPDNSTDPPGLFEQLADLPEPPLMLRWDDALRRREQPGGNAEVAHRIATMLHLGNLAIRLGRKLRWDPEAETIVGDDAANRFVNVPMREPWHL